MNSDRNTAARLGVRVAIAGCAALASAAMAPAATAAQPATATAVADLPSVFAINIPAAEPLRVTASPDPEHDLRAAVSAQSFRFASDPVRIEQKFVVVPIATGRVNVCSDSVSVGLALSCLDIDDDSTAAGARVVLRPFDGTVSQQWIVGNVDSTRPATVGLRNFFSGKYLSAGASPSQGGPLRQQDASGPGQAFFIVDAQ